MTDRDPEPLEFDELEPLPEGAELAELPDDALVELPDDVMEVAELEELPVEPEPAPKPKPVPAAKPVAKPMPAPKPAPVPRPAAMAQPTPAKKVAAAPTPPPAAMPEATAPAHHETAMEELEEAAAETALPLAAGHRPITPITPKAEAEAPVAPKAGGSRREREGRDKEARQSKPKAKAWDRWPGPGAKPKRDMEQAPTILRKAALGLLIGCLLPWGGITEAWAGNVGEKLIVLLGLYLWHQAHLLRDGVKVPGFVAALGKSSFIPLIVLAGILALVGFLPILSWEVTFDDFLANSGPLAEKGFLILAGLTWTHIYDYEHGGKFNPMFPIMFAAPAIAGVMALLKVFSAESIGLGQILGGLGAILVGFAGSMAAYTMYVAIKEAKLHGEAKKAEQAEARKTARAARRS